MSTLIMIVFVGMILLGEFVDRYYVSFFLCAVIGICILETRKALGPKIPDELSWLVWSYAIVFGIPYFWFGYTGIVLFSLLIFIIGCAITIFKNLPEGSLQNFAFVLIYPALLLSTLFYINKSASSVEIGPGNPMFDNGYIVDSLRGEQLLPLNTVGLALVFAISCMSDVCALIFGVLFGKHKLAPVISPNKTVEGAIGGVFGGIVGAGLVFFLFEALPLMNVHWFKAGIPLSMPMKIICYLLMGIFGSICTQIGDLLASYVKRHCGIKDYSHLLGSHGGFMDRFDGIMLNSVFVAVIWTFIL